MNVVIAMQLSDHAKALLLLADRLDEIEAASPASCACRSGAALTLRPDDLRQAASSASRGTQ